MQLVDIKSQSGRILISVSLIEGQRIHLGTKIRLEVG